jgi:hypothetical protein
VVPPRTTECPGVRDQALDLTDEPLVFRRQRVLERQRLAPERYLVLVLRVGAVDRIA